MMRFQLPLGMAGISAQGIAFQADDDGIVEIPDGTPQACIDDILSPHGLNLTALPDMVRNTEEATPMAASEEKRLIRSLLSMYGERVGGRSTLTYLRDRLAESLAKVMAAPPAQAAQADDMAAAAEATAEEAPASQE